MKIQDYEEEMKKEYVDQPKELIAFEFMGEGGFGI